MDQREEWRSLYSVVCPRCESISDADDLSCPYCGADRHGAVLTHVRADASLTEMDDTLRAMVRAASARVADNSTIGSSGNDPSRRETHSRSLLLTQRISLVAVMAVVVCIVLGSFGWMRTASDQSVHGSNADAVRTGGVIRTLVAPGAQSGSAKMTAPVKPEGSVALAQNHSPAATDLMSRAAFSLQGAPRASLCIVTARSASVFEAWWCDFTALMQGALVMGSATAASGATVRQSAEKAPGNNTRVAPSPEMSHAANARYDSSYINGRTVKRVDRAGSAPQSVRHLARAAKAHSDTPVLRHAVAPRKTAEVHQVDVLNSVALPIEPALTSSARENPGPVIRADAFPINRGRGEAH